jgi:hypothetical protein
MPHSSPSVLITEEGRRVLLRLQGRFYELSQEELRTVLGLPAGPPGLGVTIDRGRLRFDFAADDRTKEVSAEQLHRRLAKQLTNKE